MNVSLKWNDNVKKQNAARISFAQKFIDNEVLRKCEPYIPFQTGTLAKSGILGTEIGSGKVRYTTPYASYQYYNTSKSRDYDSMRGSYWFERMKADHKQEILAGAQKLLKE